MGQLANALGYFTVARADMRTAFYYLLLRDCGIFTQVPGAIALISDEGARSAAMQRYEEFLMEHDD
jgi:hypothetical protein